MPGSTSVVCSCWELMSTRVAAMRSSALHRSIAEIYDFYEAPTVFYIVMEFVDGGELLDH